MLQSKYNRLIIIPGFFSKQIKSSAVFAGFTAFYSEFNIIPGLYLQFFNSKITDSFSIYESPFLIDFPCNKFPILLSLIHISLYSDYPIGTARRRGGILQGYAGLCGELSLCGEPGRGPADGSWKPGLSAP